MTEENTPAAETITAHPINRRHLKHIFPARLGRLRRIIENMICVQLAQLSLDYRGGYWNCYQLSNGGFYMAPDAPEKLTLYYTDTYFEGELSADAAGIVACLLLLNRLGAETKEAYFEQSERSLRAYAATHAEAEVIFAVID